MSDETQELRDAIDDAVIDAYAGGGGKSDWVWDLAEGARAYLDSFPPDLVSEIKAMRTADKLPPGFRTACDPKPLPICEPD